MAKEAVTQIPDSGDEAERVVPKSDATQTEKIEKV